MIILSQNEDHDDRDEGPADRDLIARTQDAQIARGFTCLSNLLQSTEAYGTY